MEVMECEGVIDEAVRAVLAGEDLSRMAPRRPFSCGSGCGGNAMGCG